MKKIITTLLLTLMSISTFAEESTLKDNRDLTQFDHPFILGEWSVVPRYAELVFGADYIVDFNDDYEYVMKIVKDDVVLKKEIGSYSLEENEITLISNKGKILVYPIYFNYEKMSMNEYPFNKTVKSEIIGEWESIEVGSISGAPTVDLISVNFFENFVFQLKSEKNGKSTVNQGIYTVVDNDMILFFKEGQNAARFKLEEDSLLLDIEDGDLLTRMKKPEKLDK